MNGEMEAYLDRLNDLAREMARLYESYNEEHKTQSQRNVIVAKLWGLSKERERLERLVFQE